MNETCKGSDNILHRTRCPQCGATINLLEVLGPNFRVFDLTISEIGELRSVAKRLRLGPFRRKKEGK